MSKTSDVVKKNFNDDEVMNYHIRSCGRSFGYFLLLIFGSEITSFLVKSMVSLVIIVRL